MAVAITNDLQRARLLRVLYELLALERGVLECYEAMPRHLDHAVNEQLESFKEDHRSHARELAACVVELGGRVNGDAGRSSALDLETSDGPFTPLMLMWTNEDEMARAYEEALSRRILLPRGASAEAAQRLRAEGWVTLHALDGAPGDKTGDEKEARRLGCSHLWRNGAAQML